MLRHHQTGHPIMGEIAHRRIAVFTGHAYRKSYIAKQAYFSKKTCTIKQVE